MTKNLSTQVYTFRHEEDTAQSRQLTAHFNLLGHDFNRNFKMTPTDRNSVNLQRLENTWIDKLNTLHPSGLNTNYNVLPSPIPPAILPFCRKSNELAKYIKREYSRLMETSPDIFTQKIMIAYSSNKNLKNMLVVSTFKDRRSSTR